MQDGRRWPGQAREQAGRKAEGPAKLTGRGMAARWERTHRAGSQELGRETRTGEATCASQVRMEGELLWGAGRTALGPGTPMAISNQKCPTAPREKGSVMRSAVHDSKASRSPTDRALGVLVFQSPQGWWQVNGQTGLPTPVQAWRRSYHAYPSRHPTLTKTSRLLLYKMKCWPESCRDSGSPTNPRAPANQSRLAAPAPTGLQCLLPPLCPPWCWSPDPAPASSRHPTGANGAQALMVTAALLGRRQPWADTPCVCVGRAMQEESVAVQKTQD